MFVYFFTRFCSLFKLIELQDRNYKTSYRAAKMNSEKILKKKKKKWKNKGILSWKVAGDAEDNALFSVLIEI